MRSFGNGFVKPIPDAKMPVLTGDASESDVVSDKTFYSTHPKTKRTGNGDSAKRFASGTVTAGSAISFVKNDGSTQSWYPLIVAGLTFLPAFIEISADLYGKTLYSQYDRFGSNLNTKIIANVYADSTVTGLQLDGTQAYVTASGFRLPCAYTGVTFTWRAREA